MELNSISSDLIRGHIDTIILHALKNGDKFAGQISDFIEEKSNSQYKINQATLYSSLKRLESLKYVSSYMYDIEGGRRKFFKITTEGLEYVDKNLNSWTFSRSIIDKLMDVEQPEIKTIVYTQSPTLNIENNQENSNDLRVDFDTYNKAESNINNQKYIEKIDEIKDLSNSKDIEGENQNSSSNFRSILLDLISLAKKTSSKNESIAINEEIEPENQAKTENKSNFNEVIDNVDYIPNKANNNGKIDFGDLVLKASSEGYKIRISSKDSATSHGNVLKNKVNFFSVLLVYLLSVIQIFALDAILGDIFANYTKYIVCGVLALIPIYFLVLFIKSPNLKTEKNYAPDKILTAIIVVFNLILITLALNFIFNVDYGVIKNVVYYNVLPLIAFVDGIIYFILEYVLASSKKFNKS